MALRRTALGFIVAPVSPALLAIPIGILGNGPIGGLALGIYALFINAVVGYPAALVVGVPAYLFCQWRRWVSRRFYILGGLAAGLGLGSISAGTTLFNDPWITTTSITDALFVAGLATGVITLSTTVFWYIVRPDRVLASGQIKTQER